MVDLWYRICAFFGVKNMDFFGVENMDFFGI